MMQSTDGYVGPDRPTDRNNGIFTITNPYENIRRNIQGEVRSDRVERLQNLDGELDPDASIQRQAPEQNGATPGNNDGYERAHRPTNRRTYEVLFAVTSVWSSSSRGNTYEEVVLPRLLKHRGNKQGNRRCILGAVALLLLVGTLFAASYMLGYRNGQGKDDPLPETSTQTTKTSSKTTVEGNISTHTPVYTTSIGEGVSHTNHLITTPSTFGPTTNILHISSTYSPKDSCIHAKNLSEPWRIEHDGNDYRPDGDEPTHPGYACDLDGTFGWFRFTGQAGKTMLNKCPKFKSCGARYPLWTDAQIPNVVGAVATGEAYSVLNDNCKQLTRSILVMRCSAGDKVDVIYKYVGRVYEHCLSTFCGM